jgi:hypothetical protein
MKRLEIICTVVSAKVALGAANSAMAEGLTRAEVRAELVKV